MDERFLDDTVDYLEAFTGLRSPSSNLAHLKRVLGKQAAAAGITPDRLAAAIRRDEASRQRFINAVMIGETYLFREAPQFRLLRDSVIGRLSRSGRKLTCWSVSCSTGEEAVSLAVVLDDYRRDHGGEGFAVYASDINDEALEILRAGIYPRSALRKDGEEFHRTLLDRHVVRQDERNLTIDPALLAGISVRHLNFFRDSLDSIPDGLDLLFFRNTLLYASLDKREAILERIVRKVRPGGALFLATSELPFVKRHDLRLEERNHVYYLIRGDSALAQERSPAPGPRADSVSASTLPAPPPAVEPAAPALASAEAVLRLLNLNGGEAPAPVEGDAGPRAGPDGDVARIVARFYSAMNLERHDEAATVLEELAAVSSAGVEPLLQYCRGWYGFAKGDSERAKVEFDRALAADGSFWPARFYRAVLEAPSSRRKARREFERCIATIDQQSASRRELFAFLLEGFNIAYFRHMCVRWIEKLAEDGSPAWP